MGIDEEAKACKLEKSSSPPPQVQQVQQQQQSSLHVYPDWAAMQAYYGPRMAVPPYFNSAVPSGHGPPPYMWGPPQHMMPPYAAFYTHGGVYAHPAVHIATSPLNIDSPSKSSGNSDQGLMKKLKGFDGLAMSIGNGNFDGAEGRNDNGISHSGETEGSSEGSDGNTTEGGQNAGKRSREGSPILSEVGKAEPKSGELPCIGADGASSKMTGLAVASANVLGKVGGVLPANPVTELNLKNSPGAAANMTSATVTLIPNEALLQNDRELKRERRKQSNRESARRSRLRKQAEAEELAVKVETLNGENLTLRSEINRLTDNSEKLKLQNAKLMEILKDAQKEQVTEHPRCEKKGSSLSTANLLSRVDNSSGSVVRNDGEGELHENNKNPESGGKLHQLLDSSPRADAVAAG